MKMIELDSEESGFSTAYVNLVEVNKLTHLMYRLVANQSSLPTHVVCIYYANAEANCLIVSRTRQL